jgi:hypothetical protein
VTGAAALRGLTEPPGRGLIRHQRVHTMQLRFEFQQNVVMDEVSAITAVVRPILLGILYGLKGEVIAESGGHTGLKLFMLARLRRPGDGDVGICFEYAVHDALMRQDPRISERIANAMAVCNVPGASIASILFGAEKTGAISLIDTAKELLTPQSDLLYGTRGRPVKLKGYIDSVAKAFRKPDARQALPQSISGLWKTDLFTGFRDTEKWIGTTLKINRDRLEGARGLRLGIVPAHEGESDRIVRDDAKNLIICPLPYDASFMQIFYQAWEVVVQFLAAQARVPPEVNLPRPASRQVARYLADRREHPVLQVVDALRPLEQPELLRTQEGAAAIIETRAKRTETTTLVAPMPRTNGGVGA